MCVIVIYSMTCPRCGHRFNWCNGGDVLVCPSQLFPQCPKCKYETMAFEFTPIFPTINNVKNNSNDD